jgi:SAM-dependent methyltransferase
MGKKQATSSGDTEPDEVKVEAVPMEVSEEEYDELVAQVAELSEHEAQDEWLECARYGEVDTIRALVQRFPSLVEHADTTSKNSALHMAAANGHVSLAKLLLMHKHIFTKNEAGNTPLHWAASNGQSEMVEFLTNQKDFEVDVLDRNDFGRSALTEGFTSQKEGVVTALLEHDSASEEKLLSTSGKSGSSIVHKFFNKEQPLLIRELAIANADNPFADTDRPDQDTTGFSIWSASLVLARWMNTKQWDNASVLELGAGCGVPGLAVALSNPPPKQVYVTDLNPQTVDNLNFNIYQNKFSNVEAICMDWEDRSTWPKETLEYVIGSDLIYQASLVPLLVNVVLGLLQPGGFFYYVAPNYGRDGLDDFIQCMKSKCPEWKEEVADKEYHANPLTNEDDDECFLHFQELSSLTFMLYEFRKPLSFD